MHTYVYLHDFMCTTCVQKPMEVRKASDSTELELPEALSCHVDAWNQTLDLCKSREVSQVTPFSPNFPPCSPLCILKVPTVISYCVMAESPEPEAQVWQEQQGFCPQQEGCKAPTWILSDCNSSTLVSAYLLARGLCILPMTKLRLMLMVRKCNKIPGKNSPGSHREHTRTLWIWK